MLKEIYHRLPEESNYIEGFLEHSNVLETYIEKIKMILNTSKGEVIGFPNFGVNLENLIFELTFNADQIRNEIFSQINAYCGEAQYFDTAVDVQFAQGTVRDMAIVDITVNSNKAISVLLR